MAFSKKELSAADLTGSKRNWIQYSKQHNKRLPPGSVAGFEWKDYCPKVFRFIQELDNVDNEEYMSLVCSDETVRHVSSSWRPGSMFQLSMDNRFVIKTVRKSEVKVLLDMLPDYYNHVKKYCNTLLNRLYGVHVVKPVGGIKVYFVVVANIFKSNLLVHRCYDLKGSTQGRRVEKTKYRGKTIFKDSDLEFLFYFDPLVRHRLLKQINHDCDFLEAAGVMNYSLMLGLHVKGLSQGSLDGTAEFSPDSRASVDSIYSSNSMRISTDSLNCSLSQERSSISSARDSIDSTSFSVVDLVSDTSFQEIEELSFGEQWLQNNSHRFTLGEAMSARGVRISKIGTGGISRHNFKSLESHDVILYFGIVDFTQNYNVVKRIEHAYKSLQFDRKMIASVNPKAYSSRFQDFISDIFKEEDGLQ